MIRPDAQLSKGPAGWAARFPWWLLAIGVGIGFTLLKALGSDTYAQILRDLLEGLGVTLGVTAVAFPLAIGVGLLAGLGLLSQNPVRLNLFTAYVQIARGLPVLVQIFIVAFVLVPLGVKGVNACGAATHLWGSHRDADVPMIARVVVALVFAYGAFEAETIRGGLTSLARGQAEASRALGLSRRQALAHVLLPQTFRRILPTLGNDLICLLKDSSLVSVLGVRDITQQARLYASASFSFTETYTMLAVFYLTLALLLALGVKALEGAYRRHGA